MDFKDDVKQDFSKMSKVGLGVFSQRPLSPDLLRYAAEDVLYLPQLYQWFRKNCLELIEETVNLTEKTCLVYSNLNIHT